MDSSTKVIDLIALSNFKALQDDYNSTTYMSRAEFLNDNGLIKSDVLSIAIENNVATYSDIYSLFYDSAPEEDETP